jgi:cytosine deaminase
MDATLSYGLPRVNASGTLLEGIALWGELKPTLTRSARRAGARLLRLGGRQGLLAIRSHVDVCDPRLLAVDALLDVRERVRPYLDLQLVAFPQDGPAALEGAQKNLERALDKGVDVVGAFRTSSARWPTARSRSAFCARSPRSAGCASTCIATRRTIRCRGTSRRWRSRRSGSDSRPRQRLAPHIDALDGQLLRVEADPADRRGGRVRRRQSADQHHDPGTARHVSEAPRHDPRARADGGRGDVAFGHDCVLDPWYPLGSADMLEVAHMGLHVAQMTGQAAMRACFDAVTTTPARILGLEGYGLARGCHADFVLLEARDPVEAIRLRATRLAVVRRGKVVARTPSAAATLDLPGRPGAIRYRIGE